MRENIYYTVRNRIIRGMYEQGEVIREADLAQEFQVSRTPIREVFQNLQRDKLINLLPYRGAQVTFIEFDFLFQAVAVKTELESMAVRVAAKRITDKEIEQLRAIARETAALDIAAAPDKKFDEILRVDTLFHSAVRKASRNSVLATCIEELQAHVDRFYYYTRYAAARTFDHFGDDFEQIIGALERHDPAAADAALRTHMSSYYEILRTMYGEML